MSRPYTYGMPTSDDLYHDASGFGFTASDALAPANARIASRAHGGVSGDERPGEMHPAQVMSGRGLERGQRLPFRTSAEAVPVTIPVPVRHDVYGGHSNLYGTSMHSRADLPVAGGNLIGAGAGTVEGTYGHPSTSTSTAPAPHYRPPTQTQTQTPCSTSSSSSPSLSSSTTTTAAASLRHPYLHSAVPLALRTTSLPLHHPANQHQHQLLQQQQLILRAQHQHQHQHQQQQQQQHQHQHQREERLQPLELHRSARPAADGGIAVPAMAQNNGSFAPGMSEDEMARLQQLSANFEPEAIGPLLSEKVSTSVIADEYAAADPIYREKTANIPQQYSYYRTCRGDGHCGWRAVAFCYYETLLHLGDTNKYAEEETRVRSFGNLIQGSGYGRDIFEDWEDETVDLLKLLSSSSSLAMGYAALMDAFNEGGSWQSIITYFKTLTAARIRTHQEKYAPFFEPETVDSFLSCNVEPSQCEIENIGLMALFDVLLKPAGITLEVMYLDRSAGPDLVRHRFDVTDPTGIAVSNVPTVRLLYRPGHYDILYSFADQAARAIPATANASVHQPLTVALASSPDEPQDGLYATPHLDFGFAGLMPMIPGMSGVSAPGISGPEGLWMSPSTSPTGVYPAASMYDFMPQSAGIASMPRDYPLTHQAVKSEPATPSARQGRFQPIDTYFQPTPMTSPVSYIALPPPPTNAHEMFMTPACLALRNRSQGQNHNHHGAPAGNMPTATHERGRNTMFRPSRWEYEGMFNNPVTGGGPPPNMRGGEFQTSIFRNSHFNTSHFRNPDFHPEEWTPSSAPNGERSTSRLKSIGPSQ